MSEYDKIQKSMNVSMPAAKTGEMIEIRTDFSTPVPPMPRQANTTISGVMTGAKKK
jgi:hypothetical protein